MTDSSNNSTASGWYPDPEGSGFQRYHDGTSWGLLINGDLSAFNPDAGHPAPAGSYTNQDGETHYWTGTSWGEDPADAPGTDQLGLDVPPALDGAGSTELADDDAPTTPQGSGVASTTEADSTPEPVVLVAADEPLASTPPKSVDKRRPPERKILVVGAGALVVLIIVLVIALSGSSLPSGYKAFCKSLNASPEMPTYSFLSPPKSFPSQAVAMRDSKANGEIMLAFMADNQRSASLAPASVVPYIRFAIRLDHTEAELYLGEYHDYATHPGMSLAQVDAIERSFAVKFNTETGPDFGGGPPLGPAKAGVNAVCGAKGVQAYFG